MDGSIVFARLRQFAPLAAFANTAALYVAELL